MDLVGVSRPCGTSGDGDHVPIEASERPGGGLVSGGGPAAPGIRVGAADQAASFVQGADSTGVLWGLKDGVEYCPRT